MSSIPVTDPSVDPRDAITIGGELPSPIAPPSGCRFRTRCPSATEVCAQEEPVLRELRAGQFVACHFPVETLPTGEHVVARPARRCGPGRRRRAAVAASPGRSGQRAVAMAWADDVAGAPTAGQGGDPAGRRRRSWARTGYEGASMRDMAARAGVSVAAIYYHFPSKHDLLREFLDEAWRIALDRIDRRLRAVDDDPFGPARRDRRHADRLPDPRRVRPAGVDRRPARAHPAQPARAGGDRAAATAAARPRGAHGRRRRRQR